MALIMPKSFTSFVGVSPCFPTDNYTTNGAISTFQYTW
nr:MAG TPA: hypothetical protein [Caudoviricetes sp.]